MEFNGISLDVTQAMNLDPAPEWPQFALISESAAEDGPRRATVTGWTVDAVPFEVGDRYPDADSEWVITDILRERQAVIAGGTLWGVALGLEKQPHR